MKSFDGMKAGGSTAGFYFEQFSAKRNFSSRVLRNEWENHRNIGELLSLSGGQCKHVRRMFHD
jgi:hypothetical protein